MSTTLPFSNVIELTRAGDHVEDLVERTDEQVCDPAPLVVPVAKVEARARSPVRQTLVHILESQGKACTIGCIKWFSFTTTFTSLPYTDIYQSTVHRHLPVYRTPTFTSVPYTDIYQSTVHRHLPVYRTPTFTTVFA